MDHSTQALVATTERFQRMVTHWEGLDLLQQWDPRVVGTLQPGGRFKPRPDTAPKMYINKKEVCRQGVHGCSGPITCVVGHLHPRWAVWLVCASQTRLLIWPACLIGVSLRRANLELVHQPQSLARAPSHNHSPNAMLLFRAEGVSTLVSPSGQLADSAAAAVANQCVKSRSHKVQLQ